MPSVDLTHFTSMSKQSTPNDQNFDTGEFETGEFETGELNQSGVHSRTGVHRRRRRKSKKKKSNRIGFQIIGFLLFGALTIGIGVIVGSGKNTGKLEFERNQIAFENRLRAERRWLGE